MRAIRKTLILATMSTVLCSGLAFAQDDHHDQDRRNQEHHDQQDHHEQQDQHDHYVRHNEWRRGGHIDRGDWDRGRPADWHARHLRRPPRGYEWREVDGNYVLAAIASGVIASVVIAANSH